MNRKLGVRAFEIVVRYLVFVAVVLRHELGAALFGGQPLTLNSTVVSWLLAGVVFVDLYEVIARLVTRRRQAASGATGV